MIKKVQQYFSYGVIFLFLLFLYSCTKNKTLTSIEQGIFKKSKIDNQKKGLRLVPGDTLKSVSKKYNVTIKEIVKANNLKSPFILKPGTYLKIPSPRAYIIKKKDTFYSIAKCYKISMGEIDLKNKNINEKKLKVGNIIYLPFYANKNYCKLKTKNKVVVNKKNNTSTKSIFSWPSKGEVIATFGIKSGGRKNDGINIKAAKGNPVRAALSGKVIYKGNELPSWGNLILIKHQNGWTSAYAHLSKFLVKVGDQLNTGDLIGAVGKTGNVKDFQLHFQVRKNSKPFNPIDYLARKNN